MEVFETESATSAGGRLLIDLDAIAANYARLVCSVRPARCGAVLKADAYGLGAARVAPVLYNAGCRIFFVALLSEAVPLRKRLAWDAEIFILNGTLAGDFEQALCNRVTPVLNTLSQSINWLQFLKRTARKAPVVVQLDTGMSRLGLTSDELIQLARTIKSEQLGAVDILLSHLSSADDPEAASNDRQRLALEMARRYFPYVSLSLANSAGCFLSRSYHHELCRPGAALFGLRVSRISPSMHPVVRIDLRIAQLRHVPEYTRIGYGGTFLTSRPTRVATLACGYADGIPRSLRAPAGVWLKGHRMPVVGLICMDRFMVDATDVPEPLLHEDSWVEFIGPDQTMESVAESSDTTAYELLVRLGRRYERQYRVQHSDELCATAD